MTAPPDFFNIPSPIRERVRKAVQMVEGGGHVPSVPKVRKVINRAGESVAQNHLANLIRWYKQGVLPDAYSGRWDAEVAAPPSVDQLNELEAAIRESRTNEQLAEVSRLIAAKVAAGALSPMQGNTIKVLLSEARQNVKDKTQHAADEIVEESLVPVSEDACALARVYDSIVSEEARGKILAFAKAQLDLDLVENPNVDRGA